MPFLDLTHTFTQDMPLYEGDPKPQWKQSCSLEHDQHNKFEIHMHSHVGTHIDAPWHMLADGKMLSAFSPDHFFGRGKLLDARGKTKIDADLIQQTEISAGDIVLILTGFSKKFREPEYFTNFPWMTEAFAHELVKKKVKLVGIDNPSPDGRPFTIHKILLKNDILILENLTNLEALLGVESFEVIALPPKFESDGAPIRVVARVS